LATSHNTVARPAQGLLPEILPPVIRMLGEFTPDTRPATAPVPVTSATQEAFWAHDASGQRYRLKRNPPERLLNTFHEVMSARLLHTVGLPVSPPTSWVLGPCGAIWIASPVVKGAKDLGLFLIEEGGKHVGLSQKIKYQHLLSQYEHCKVETNALRESPSMQGVLGAYQKGAFNRITDAHHQVLQPLRDHERQLLQLQDKMFALLPPKFHSALLSAAFASEVVGEWDFLNHARFNTVVAVDKHGEVNVQTVDRGVSGLVGFSGKLKSDNDQEVRVPALVDDPYAGHQKSALQSHSPYGSIDRRMGDLDFTQVPRSFGQIGALPRAGPMAFLFKQTIIAEREGLAPAPQEALEVAKQLKSINPALIFNCVQQAYDDAQKHQHVALKNLFSPAGTGVSDAEELAALYQARINAIIARSL
jgi:hypothetical protein